MSVTPELLTFGVGVDTSSAEAGLSSLGDTADGVAVGLEDRLSGASEGLKGLGRQSTTASRGISGLASVISLVDPRLGSAVRSVGALARGLGVLRLGLGPATVAIGAITAGLALYQRQQEKAAREMAEAQERADNLARALDGVSESARSVEEEVRLASGEIDSFGIAAETQAAEAQAASDLVVAAYDAEIQATENRITALRAEVKQGKNVSDELREQRLNLIDLTTARDNEIVRVERQIDTIGLLLEFREESRKAIEAEAEAERQAAEARRNRERADRERASALLELSRIETDARRSTMTEEAALIEQYEERIDRVRELGQLTGEDVSSTVAALELAAQQDLMELRQQEFEREKERQSQLKAEKNRKEQEERDFFEEMSALRRAEHDQTIAELNEQREKIADNIQGMSDLYSSASSLISDLAGLAAGEDEEAQARAAKLDKGLNIAGALIGGVVGVIVNTLLGNPVGAVSSGLGGASGVIRAATAHQGDRIAPDEEMVRTVILRDEKITPDARVISPEGSRRMERGEDGGAHVVTVPIYQHFGEFFADVVEGGGTPLHDLINQGRDVGRRRA